MQRQEHAGERKRNTDAGQQRQAMTEEEPGYRQHHDQAEQRVRLHDPDGFTRSRALIVEQGQDRRTESLVGILHQGMDGVGQRQGIDVLSFDHGQQNSRLAIQTNQFARGSYAGGDGGKFADFDHAAIRADNRQFGEKVRIGIETLDAHRVAATGNIRHAGRHAARMFGDGARQRLQRYAALFQSGRIEGHGNLAAAHAIRPDAPDAGQFFQLVPRRFRQVADAAIVRRAADHHHRGREKIRRGQLDDLRRARVFRKIGGSLANLAIQRGKTAFEAGMVKVMKADQQRRHMISRSRCDKAHIADPPRRRFQRQRDLAFHIARSRARPDHGNRHPVQFHFRILRARHGVISPGAKHQNQRQNQVGKTMRTKNCRHGYTSAIGEYIATNRTGCHPEWLQATFETR